MSRSASILRGLLITAALTSAAGPVLAQGSPASRMPSRGSAVQNEFQFEGDLQRQNLNKQALASASPERIARAQRIAALIDSGNCPAAEQLAAIEKDGQMLLRVRKVCKKK